MNKRSKKRIGKTLIVLAVLICMIVYAVYWAFFDLQRIEGEKFLSDTISPQGTYTVTAYLNNGGATTSYAVLCTVRNNERHRVKNIYWEYRTDTVEMEWLDDENIRINNVVLNVEKETYDYRRN
jgi:hypothetical protein